MRIFSDAVQEWHNATVPTSAPGGLPAAPPAQRDQVIGGVQPVAGYGVQERGGLRRSPHSATAVRMPERCQCRTRRRVPTTACG